MGKKGDILILSTGRRVELVQGFGTETAKFSNGIRILTVDMNPCMSSACHVSNGAFPVPSVQSGDYIDRISDLAAEEDIGLIIPTIDTELYKLPEVRTRSEEAGIHVVISDSELVALCRDERKIVGLFVRHDIRSSEVYDRNRLAYPCLVKPYNGSRAIGARHLDRVADLTPEVLANSKLMFCRLIGITEEFQESAVGMYYDRRGHLKCAVPREHLEVRAGEVSRDVARRNSLYGLLIENMAAPEDARGCTTAQFSSNGHNDVLYDMEVNPCFGGGFPLTYAAGGNYSGWLIREYLYGEEILFSDQWEDNLIMLCYDARVLVHGQD